MKLVVSIYIVVLSTTWAEIFDMTHSFDKDAKHWPAGQSDFHLKMLQKGLQNNGAFWLQNDEITSGIHVGTHMDAPRHFCEDCWTIDKIPAERLFKRPAVMVDIRQKSAQSPDAYLGTDDLIQYEAMYGKIPRGAVILQCSGWSDKYDNEAAYMGNDQDDVPNFHFPGFHVDAVQWLIDNREIYGLAVDGPSIDRASASATFPAHTLYSRHNIYSLENVKDTCYLPPAGATIYVLPSKIKEASGGHTRVIAEWDNSASTATTIYITMGFAQLCMVFVSVLFVQ